ncbi:hypothetical protein [Sorangium sp. So ce128]|uniref:hypothetical protein n=1 Tax=Sorangium sp. So ce128 TaxID=3133281 RepID=UPI003F63234E
MVPGAIILLALGATACGIEAPLTDSVGTPLGEKSAAIVLENLDNDTSMNLVARVEVQPDELLEFYEPAPGLIVVSRAGAPEGGISPLPRAATGSGIRELWARATNGLPPTVELEGALERAEQHRVARRVDVDSDAGSTRSAREVHAQPLYASATERPAISALSGGWCDTVYLAGDHGNCTIDASENYAWSGPISPDYVVCLPDREDGASYSRSDVNYGYASVCAAEGTPFLFNVSSDEVGGAIWSVALNTWREFYLYDDGCTSDPFDDCASMNVSVTQASGDRFHFHFLVRED